MNELEQISAARERGGVLATVVHVKGSAYRRPGARMLILPDGTRIGSISGGCLEGEVARKAWWLTDSGRPVVRNYDTSSDEGAVWEFGLGCNGVVQVLLERVDAPEADELFHFLDCHLANAAPAAIATVVRGGSAPVGARLFFDGVGTSGTALAGTPLEAAILPHLRAAMRETKSRFAYLDDAEVFVEWVGVPLHLVIFGAGHDAIPLVSIARQFGWRVTVADGRPAYANASRFPQADRVVVMKPGYLLSGISLGPLTAVVMMTHNYPLDEMLLPGILAARPWYLGLLGPKSRTANLFHGSRVPSCVHAPVGLDLGGEAPVSIALSIASEIQAALHERGGGMLRERAGAIHAPVKEAGTPASGSNVPYERPSYCETHA